jgi:hypothetical protein
VNGLLSPHERGFRDEVRTFLAETAHERDERQFYLGRGGATRALYQRLGERGWLSLTWPKAHGGSALPVVYDFVLWNEMAYARAARPDLGPGIVATILIEHGSADQQDRLLPGIRSGEQGYALGYSEPEAGCDLTGLRTRAALDGDTYIVNGEKVWTSDAHTAAYLWLLCRTGSTESRARGLTLLAVDLASPGITVRPIPTIDGHRLNQVALDDVAVPAANRIGSDGAAWTMMRAALAVERHLQLLPGRVQRDLDSLVDLVESLDLMCDSHVRHRLADLAVKVDQVTAASLATVAALTDGESGIVPAAAAKLLGTGLAQEMARTAVELTGEPSLVAGETFELLWRQSIMETIAGGTSEIMLGLLSREALGLGATR